MMHEGSARTVGFLMHRLERAAQRTQDHWIPINPATIATILKGLRSGDYRSDPERLIREIKSDFSLFLFCIRESLAALRLDKAALPPDATPFQILRLAGIHRLARIIEQADHRISTHSLSAASPAQQQRLKEALISASTAELLADHNTSELGFTIAALRQLGLALIAWNYPTIYQRALRHSDDKVTLEAAINEMLGFSPALLGSYILSRWGIRGELRAMVGSEPGELAPKPLSETQQFICKICEVGEALSRAAHPECYPSAEQDWELARQEIRLRLGIDGLGSIQERVRESCAPYRELFREIFSDTVLFNPASSINALKDLRAYTRNPYLRSCQPAVQQALQGLYATMESNAVSQQAVRSLARELFPTAGFLGGCVFVLDPAVRQFVPRLTFGSLTLRSATTISYSRHATEGDPVLRAFDCQAPLINHAGEDSAHARASITAALGSTQKIGVLYVEIAQVALDAFDRSIVSHFKALRRALEDALRLS